MALFDIHEVKNYLPHRYPFLLVDKVIEEKVGEYIVGIKNVTINEDVFNGHFPGKAVMPGVLMVEALAQVSGILTFNTLGEEPDNGDLYFLAGLDNVRFKRMVVPGDQLQLRVEIITQRKSLWKFKGEATVDGELACTAEFMNIRGK